MSYQKLPFHPGIYKDDSPLEAKGYWIEADKIRFVRGLPETIYGWEKASNSTLLGICRGAMTWADNARNPFAAFGTHLRLYAMDVDGNVTDITPVASYGQLANPFATDGTTATITVTHAAHGLATSQAVTWPDAPTINGAATTATKLYAVTVVNANTYTFSADSVSTSSGSGVGGTVNYWYRLAPGQIDGLGGLGYGVGGYGSGTYGGSSAGYTLYPRTWSLAPWGQNLIANPRGGGIYEWAPNGTATELVTNGTFTGSSAGWTLSGAGLAYSANTLAWTGASNGTATQSIALPVAAWCRLQFDVSAFAAGTLQASVGGTNVGSAIAANGRAFVSFFTGAGGAKNLVFTGAGFTGSLDNVSVQVETYGNPIANAPTQVTCIFSTAERILVACGCPDTSANFDAMRVRWTDTQNNQTWTAAASNLAGAYQLTNGSRIVRGLPGNRENLILTDSAAYAMRYVPDPNVVYSFTEIASGCGLIGPNAVTQVGGVFYWMDVAGGFWAYDGSYPRPLRCTLARDVRDNNAFSQQDKVYAFPLTVNGRIEVWWQYPDSRDGNECSRYVAYQITESEDQGAPVWTSGTFARTSWINAGVYQYPLAVDTAGAIWFHEKGFTQDGAARSWSITSAYVDLGDGDTHMRIMGIQPDAEDLQGGYTITIATRIHNGSGITRRSFGPYGVTAATGKISARANGEEGQIIFAGNGAPTFWRLGAVRFDMQTTERRR